MREKDVQDAKRAKLFSARTFREELKGSEALKSLKKFISYAQSDEEDVILEYMESKGSIREILSLIDATAQGDLTTALPVFEAVHLIILRFQSSDSKYYHHCLDSVKCILRSHVLTIQSLLSMNTLKHKKVVLKLLTTIVTLNSSFAFEVLNLFTPTSSMVTDLTTPAPEKESVRKYFILFILSFLIDGSPAVIKALMDNKGFLSIIIPGLKYDEASTVCMALSLMENKILKNVKILKTLKLKTFNTHVIKSLFELFDWKGPQGVKKFLPGKKKKLKVTEVNQEDKTLVADSLHSFLIVLCTSKKFGVSFADKSTKFSVSTCNQLLLSVFEGLSNPLGSDKISDVILKTLLSCPDLVQSTLLKLEPFFQPRSSKNWMDAMKFAEKLVEEMDIVQFLQSEKENPGFEQYASKITKAFCTPLVFLRTAKTGAQPSQPVQVRLVSLKLVATMWNSASKVITTLPKIESSLRKAVGDSISTSLPDFEDLVDLFYQVCDIRHLDSCTTTKIADLRIVLKCLHMSVQYSLSPETSLLNLAFDLFTRLEEVQEVLQPDNYLKIRAYVLKFIQLDISSLRPDMDLFRKALLISLQSSGKLPLSCARNILSNIDVFKENKSEVDVWLMSFISLPFDSRLHLSNCLVDCIESAAKDDPVEGESFTPFLYHCVHQLKTMPETEPEAKHHFKRFLQDVIMHLQHLYPETSSLYENFKGMKKTVGKSLVEYLRCWMANSLPSSNQWTEYLCPEEGNFESWLLTEDDDRDIQQVLPSGLDATWMRYRLFIMMMGRLVLTTANQELTEKKSDKYLKGLMFFLERGGGCASDDDDDHDHDESSSAPCHLTNDDVFREKCIEYIFENETLSENFNVFPVGEKKLGSFRLSRILVKSVMKKETEESEKGRPTTKTLAERWKTKFLKQLKRKIRKNESIEMVEDLEVVLNFFDYDHREVVDVVNLLTEISDVNLFVKDTHLTKWTHILVEFVKLHSAVSEVPSPVIKKLCALMKNLQHANSGSLQALDDCFLVLVRKHPTTLSSIDNDFFDTVLLRGKADESAVTLGKLLLNDPAKVKHLLGDAFERVPFETLFPLLSTLLFDEDSFFEAIKSEKICMVWKFDEVSQAVPELFECLEKTYGRFREKLIRAMKGVYDPVVLENFPLVECLIGLFVDKDAIKSIKKDIRRGNFDPVLVFQAVKKFGIDTLTETYVHGLIRLVKTAATQTDFVEEKWTRLNSILFEVIKLKKSSEWEKVADSDWNDFVKIILGTCLKTGKHAGMLKTLRILITALHSPGNDYKERFSHTFQMVISHSQFLNVVLGKSALKRELVELFYALVEKCPGEMSPKHVPILLASYGATMSETDRTVLKILQLYEGNGLKFGDYEPLVWGETAVSHYSIGTGAGLSLWQRFNMLNVLNLLDPQKLDASLKDFPIHRTLQVTDVEKTDFDADIYDPAFLLPLFANLLSPGSVVFLLPFVYKGGLAYTIRALSSECSNMRKLASLVLARYYNHLELSQNFKQKLVWIHFINCFRFGIEDISKEAVPNIFTLFIARMTLELSGPPSDMHVPLQNFLLAKSYFSFKAIPEFLPLFHSSHVSFWKHRIWLLNILKDATKTSADVQVIFYTMALKVIFCFFHSPFCDMETKRLIFQVIERLTVVKNYELLFSEYGLLNWISSIELNSTIGNSVEFLRLLETCSNLLCKNVKSNKNKQNNVPYVIQILNILMRMLPHLSANKSTDCFGIYINVVLVCLIFLYQRKESEWCGINKHKLQEIIECGALHLGVDVGKFRLIPFYFREYEKENENEVLCHLKKVVFIFHLLT